MEKFLRFESNPFTLDNPVYPKWERMSCRSIILRGFIRQSLALFSKKSVVFEIAKVAGAADTKEEEGSMPSHSARKTCFISSTAGTDLTILTAAMEGHGYDVVAPTRLRAGQPWFDALTERLKTVDLVVGVFGSREAIANPVFEIGYALGIGKPVLAIVSPTAEDLPFAFSSLLVVRAEPTDREAIEFALGSLPANPLRDPSPPIPAAPLLLSAEHLEDYTTRIKGAQNERELLDVLRTLLVDAGVEVIADARVGDYGVDFAIWSDVLGTYVGNPLIVEVKRTLRTMERTAPAANPWTTMRCAQKYNTPTWIETSTAPATSWPQIDWERPPSSTT